LNNKQITGTVEKRNNLPLQAITLLALGFLLSACASNGTSGQYKAKSALVEQADKALIHAQLARGYLQQKQYAVAKEELDEALRINPQHSQSNYIMALLMVELEQYETADKHFAVAVKSDPENSSAAHDYGMFLCQIGKERESVDFFELAADNPFFERSELSYMRAGECLARIDDRSAEQYLRRALDVNPELRPALYRLAVINFESRNYFPARAYIERYMAITKPQPAALLLAYKIESGLSAAEVAEQYRQRLLEEFPGSEQASSLRREQRGDN
jgi:type IV pilus assembly protein PilF